MNKHLALSLCALLQFFSLTMSSQTTIPVIKLIGDFNKEYQEGKFILDNDTFDIKAKWRGSSTLKENSHKHNFKINFPEDVSFFNMRSDNNWILDAGQLDPFRLRNRIATDLWLDICSRPYYYDQDERALTGVRGQVVEVYLNDQYEGVYAFTECMDRKQMRLKKQTTENIRGVLWKGVGYTYTKMWEVNEDYDNTSPTWGSFEIKYPDLDDRAETDYSTLYEAINFVVNSSDEDYAAFIGDYFDLPVIMDYYLFYNVLGAFDNTGKNLYWGVYDRTTADHRLTPAVWDLDLTVGAPEYNYLKPEAIDPYSTVFGNLNIVHRLIMLNVDNFNSRAYQRYMELRQNLFSYESLTKRYYDAAKMLVESGAAQREKERWDGDSDIHGHSIDFMADADTIANWLKIHLPHLDSMLCDTLILINMGVEELYTATPKTQDDAIYNLQGQRQNRSYALKPGVYIRRGRKYIVR